MTRKRFIKLLMADGYSRNKANSIARQAVADGYTYEFRLLLLRTGNDFPDVPLQDLKDAVDVVEKIIIESIPPIIKAIVEAIPVAIDMARQRLECLYESMREEAVQ